MTFSHYSHKLLSVRGNIDVKGGLLYENALNLSGSEVKAETIAFPPEDTVINSVKTDA